MIIHVDPSSDLPPYDQVRAGVERAVADGSLPPGTRLPTVRALAANLDLAPNTVARAYRELEALGILEGQGRRGTFVTSHAPATTGAARAAAETYAARVRDMGVRPDTALRLVRVALGL